MDVFIPPEDMKKLLRGEKVDESRWKQWPPPLQINEPPLATANRQKAIPL